MSLSRSPFRTMAWIFAVGLAGPVALHAQGGVEPSPDQVTQALASEWTANLQPTGQPVIPLFEGWYSNPDGTYSLCFGYHNLNTEQEVYLPLGPDNRIEPARFDGGQPTRFGPVPGPELEYARRYWCVFTVNVPADFGEERVVWTLRMNGRDYSVPGHLNSAHYEVDEPEHYTRGGVAPLVRFQPDGPEGRGRGGMTVGPLQARVGEPLDLSVWVDPDPRPRSLVWWFVHQGPAEVSFSDPQSEVGEEGGEVRTSVSFTEPGHYMLRLQALEDVGELEFQCCWTNAYVEVEVLP